MRIAQIAPIAERVPPKKYGGTERVIYALTEELVKKGHNVTLFASGDSITSARLISVVPKSLRESGLKDLYGYNTQSMMNMGLAYAMQDQFDVIHDHNPHIDLPTANLSLTPTVMTWHGPYDKQIERYFSLLGNNVHLVSISKSQGAHTDLSFEGTVYNGLYMEDYPFSDKPQDYLLYVGRIDEEKGTHIAIDVAVKANKKLIIAAKLDDMVPHIREYFKREVEPRLKKHANLINWIGEVDEKERNELMKNSLCLLHPITWPEPFGLTLIESMACGAPVIAFAMGSIPEVIKHGKTGFVVKDVDGMLDALKNIDKIDRASCRRYALGRFSAQNMASGYEKVYKQVIEKRKIVESIWPKKTKNIFGTLVFRPSSS
ncbi:MAG TPA: glycosyltransferase family 4 protein [Verrucomicrobiae bacterium]|nr:glycosyltransferase family 4 protein [Verrucomicrobiae bacterium]